MGKISDLLTKAKGLLASYQPPSNNATDAVVHDRFERRLFDELREDAPALDKAIERLGRDVNYAEDLVRDTMMQFWQGQPELRKDGEMANTHLANLGVARDVDRSDEFQAIRRHTKHDRYGSAMAAIGVTEKVQEWAHEHAERLEEAARAAEEAQKRAKEAAQKLQDQADELGHLGHPDFHGPLSDEQQAALDALADQLAEAQAAMDGVPAAQDDLAQVSGQAQRALATPISEAIDTTKDQLDKEAKLFNGWGITPGELKEMDLVGPFRMMEAAQQVRKVEYGRDEVVGVEMTDDLGKIVMSEYVALAMGDEDDELAEMFELDFYRRWFEGQLIGRRFEGTEKVGKGAIVCLVDTSGSMTDKDQFGIPREAWAKAFAFALLDQARRQKRDFVGINFSSSHQCSVYEFPAGRTDTAKAIQFVQQFYNGGTDFVVPINKAMDIVAKDFDAKGKSKADLVFITDDECRVSSEWMQDYQARKKKLAFRTFGIAVGRPTAGSTLTALSDNVRAVSDFADPSTVRDIFQVL